MDKFTYKTPANKTVLFNHIPKTAGTTFSYLIKHFFSNTEICPAHFWEEILKIPENKLQQYNYVGGHFHYNIRDLLPQHDFISITFLRDPIQRTLSQFDHLRRVKTPLPRHNDLEDFLDDPVCQRVSWNHQTIFLGLDVPYKAQIDSLPLEYSIPDNLTDTDILTKAKLRLHEFDVLGLTEKFQESLSLLSYVMGWRDLETRDHRNTSPNRIQKQDLSKNILNRIIDLNRLDIELYEYGKNLYEERLQEITEDANLKDIVQQHYQEYFIDNYKPRNQVFFNFSRVIPNTGWHHAEDHPSHGIYRWSGPDKKSRIDLPLIEDDNLWVKITVLAGIQSTTIECLELTVNNHQVSLELYINDDETIALTGSIPKSAIVTNGLTTFEFSVPDTIAPSDINNSEDTRPLGFAVSSIEVYQGN